MLGVASQIDSCFENLSFAQHRAAELRAIFIAVRSVYVDQTIAQYLMPSANQKDAAKLHAIQFVILYDDILRPHLDTRVIEYNAEVPERIILGRPSVGASIASHGAVMKTVQVYAFAVDLVEGVALIDTLIDIASRINANRSSAIFDVHQRHRHPDPAAVISGYIHMRRMAHLNGIAANIEELIVGDLAATVSRRHITRVRPYPIAANAAKRRIDNRKLFCSLFQKNTAGGIVAPFGI